MPWHDRSSSEKRRGPSERSCTSSAVHFAPMISAVAATAQVPATWTGFIVRTAIARIVRRAESIPGRGVVRPAAAEHGRDHLHVAQLLSLARDRVAVEHDEVGVAA